MTAILPFASAFWTGAATRPPGRADSGTQANSFADMLGAPGASSDRAFGFDELGMFGRHGAQAVASDSAASLPPAQARATDAFHGDRQRSTAEQPSASPETPEHAAAIGNEEMDPASERSTMLGEALANGPSASGLFSVAGGPAASDSEPIGSMEGYAAMQSALRAALRKDASPVSLTVSGTEDALVVVARSQNETADDRIALRRLVEDTAAKFGMRVAEFHLNGAATAPSFQTLLRGNHGHRPR